MTQGSSRHDVFRAFAEGLLGEGSSANFIVQSASDLGIGIRRSDALGIIRELRTSAETPIPPAFSAPGSFFEPEAPAFSWGDLTQQADQWARFDGPNAAMFQQLGPNADEWTNYVVLPDEEDFVSFRFVVADDTYVTADGRQPGYVTSAPFDASVPVDEAMGRLGIDPGDVARIIYDK